ncbi:MAG TPA: PEP-CTERM sorting domain-containing protein [Gammaproteobacteria bacterium]|nr:PEP-CTERM sorting domain-containing protein [Gammaproteobacteria bacterium]
MMKASTTLAAGAALLTSTAAIAGPFAPGAGVAGTSAIAKTDPAFVAWATSYSNYQPGSGVDAGFRTPEKALGPAVGDSFGIVSLGNAGSITLSFSGTLFNGPGWDFAVFENGFSNTFLELAFVEVSSDGANFFRFPSFSFTPSAVSAFGSIDPTNIDGFAGKYRQGFGTPFDLDVFKNAPGIDINAITYVRLVDVVGNGSEFDSFPTSLGGPHPIYDPYPTTGSAGFDLDAVGARHFTASPVPLPPAVLSFAAAAGVLAARRRRARDQA